MQMVGSNHFKLFFEFFSFIFFFWVYSYIYYLCSFAHCRLQLAPTTCCSCMRHGLNVVEIIELPNIRFSFHDFFMFMASFTHNIGFRRKLKYLFLSTLNLKQHYLGFCMELDAPPSFLLDPKGSNYVKKWK